VNVVKFSGAGRNHKSVNYLVVHVGRIPRWGRVWYPQRELVPLTGPMVDFVMKRRLDEQ
jgi:hypothetical protein